MRVVVNLTRCQAYAQCAFLAPEVFRMRGAEALMYDPEPDDAQRERVLGAAAACPVQAILVDHVDDREAAVESATTGPAVSARAAAPSLIVPRPRTGGRPSPDGHDAVEAVRRTGRIVIVGASLAGLAAAATLRREGFTGRLTMIGDEPYRPYDRPPLSKQVLDGWVPPDHTGLPRAGELGARWLLGVPATGLDPAARQVHLRDGGIIGYDRLLIATGTRPALVQRGRGSPRRRVRAADPRRRRAPATPAAAGPGGSWSSVAGSPARRSPRPAGSGTWRSPSSSAGPAPGRGAGRGDRRAWPPACSVNTASTCAAGSPSRAWRVTPPGGCAARTCLTAARRRGGGRGGAGRVRNTEWLRDCGWPSASGGWAAMPGAGSSTRPAWCTDDVFVAGDVARFPHPLYDYQFLALEHWGNAVAQAHIAAHNMISVPAERWPHMAIPVFWSAQFGTNIKSVGVPTLADQVVIAAGARSRSAGSWPPTATRAVLPRRSGSTRPSGWRPTRA